jgi:hypothetical protein
MGFKVNDWIENKTYGSGQIVADGGTFWSIHFVDAGEKMMGKDYIDSHGAPPHHGVTFPKAGPRAKTGLPRKIKPTATADIEHHP